MDERKRRVLQAIINDYIFSAEPVGSRTVARKYDLGVSPATIRNEMADLEDLGFLEQPHTSAGRIPSDKGYRYYVDFLLDPQPVAAERAKRIRRDLLERARELEGLIQQTVRILAEATDSLTMIMGPGLTDSVFRSIQVLPFKGERAILLIVTEDGYIENKMVDLPRPVSPDELALISHVLTERLAGQTIETLSGGAIRDLMVELGRYQDLLEQIFELLEPQAESDEDRFFLGGTTNILRQPEFRDVQKIEALLRHLEQGHLGRELLNELHDGLHVAIGTEIQIKVMQDCSLVTATYRIGGQNSGRIGVLGPRRMDYGRVISLVDLVTGYLNEILE